MMFGQTQRAGKEGLGGKYVGASSFVVSSILIFCAAVLVLWPDIIEATS